MSKINNYRNVAILMAVYNGGPYLREQIDSIIHQSFANWTLYIQDDGSSDDTLVEAGCRDELYVSAKHG